MLIKTKIIKGINVSLKLKEVNGEINLVWIFNNPKKIQTQKIYQKINIINTVINVETIKDFFDKKAIQIMKDHGKSKHSMFYGVFK